MANLSINAAAKAAGVSAGSVRNWLKSEPTLKKHTKKGKRGVEVTAAGIKELKEIAKRRRESASPALQQAWAAKKAGKKAAKKTARKTGRRSAKKVTAKRKSRGAGKKAAATRKRKAAGRKAAITRRARKVSARGKSQLGMPIQTALDTLAASVGNAVNEGTTQLKSRVKALLLQQRALIDQALEELD